MSTQRQKVIVLHKESPKTVPAKHMFYQGKTLNFWRLLMQNDYFLSLGGHVFDGCFFNFFNYSYRFLIILRPRKAQK